MLKKGTLQVYVYRQEIVVLVNIIYTKPLIYPLTTNGSMTYVMYESFTFEFGHWVWRYIHEKSFIKTITGICKSFGIKFDGVLHFTSMRASMSACASLGNKQTIIKL